jgi:aromatic ring-opening dioxygenase catalytic subunit (LigB family)
LAHELPTCFNNQVYQAAVDQDYGWDHGVFIPSKVMYPEADVPVVAMSLHESLNPELHSHLGRALTPLRDEGVLIVGAGMSYHNLRHFADYAPESYAFHDWIDQPSMVLGKNAAINCPNGKPRLAAEPSHPERAFASLMVASGAGSDLPGRVIWRGSIGPTCIGAWAFE